jgi:hypothetical protein
MAGGCGAAFSNARIKVAIVTQGAQIPALVSGSEFSSRTDCSMAFFAPVAEARDWVAAES